MRRTKRQVERVSRRSLRVAGRHGLTCARRRIVARAPVGSTACAAVVSMAEAPNAATTAVAHALTAKATATCQSIVPSE